MKNKSTIEIDVDLIVRSLELDSHVGLKNEKIQQRTGSILSPEEAESFQNGYEKATQLILASLRHILNDHFSECPRALPQRIYPHARSKQYRSEPSGWKVVDTIASKIKDQILAHAKKSSNPAVVFDLDGTLVDVSFRTLGILKEWLASEQVNKFSKSLVTRLEGINLSHIGYSLAHVFENAGLDLREEDVAKIFESTERQWRRRFFDGKALVEYDRALPGSPSFVWSLLQSGIQIIYLTGRHAASMKNGTREQLKTLGFPCDEARLFMKPDHERDDHLYKESVIKEVSETFQIIGNFENEYLNLKTMLEIIPSDCVHTIVDSQHSGRPVPENNFEIFRISDYTA